MFKTKISLPSESSMISEHCKATGKLEFTGALLIEGELIGDVTQGQKLEIGPKGRLEGNAKVDEAEIAGNFKGTMRVEKRLLLHKSAVVEGEIFMATNAFEAEPGARIEGTIHMPKREGALPSPIKSEPARAGK